MQALLHELHYRMLQGIDLFLLVPVEEHLGTAVNQESSEYEQYPGEPADECSTCEDEDEAQYDGSQNTPVQYVLVIFLVYSERGEIIIITKRLSTESVFSIR